MLLGTGAEVLGTAAAGAGAGAGDGAGGTRRNASAISSAVKPFRSRNALFVLSGELCTCVGYFIFTSASDHGSPAVSMLVPLDDSRKQLH